MIAAPTKSDVLFETLAITAYPLLRSTTVTMAWLVVRSDDGVAFPMTHLLAALNVRRALAQRPAVGDLPLAITTTGVALYLLLLLLATQVLPQRGALSLVCINMQVKRFMAHGQLAGDLPRAPLQAQQHAGLLFHLGRKRTGVAARFRAFAGKLTGLLGSIASTSRITAQLATDRGLVAS